MAPEKSKKKGMGLLFKLFIALLVVILAVFVAIKIFFPAERVKAEIIKRATAALGRTVELDDVSLSILPRLTLDLKGLRIYNPSEFPGTQFVTIDRLGCGLKIMPLLRKHFVFNQIIVDHPVVNLRKTADGRNNFTFKLATSGTGIATPIAVQDSVTAKEAALSAFAFDWAEINAADIVYQDDSAGTTMTLNNVSLATKLELIDGGKSGRSMGTLKIPSITATMLPKNIPLALELGYNADIDFQNADLVLKNTALKVNGIPFQIEATVRDFMNIQSFFARLTASGVSLEPLVAYIPKTAKFDPANLRLTGKLDGNVEIRKEFATQRIPHLGGTLTFNDLTIGYANVSNRVAFKSLAISFTPDTVSFVSQGGQLAEDDFALSGTITNWADLQYNVRIKGKYSLAGLMPFMDPAAKPEVSGLLAYDLTLSGRKSRWAETQIAGMLSGAKVYFNSSKLSAPLNRLDFDIAFAPAKTRLNSLYVEYPGVRMNMTGEIRNGLAHLLAPRKGYPRPFVDFTLTAPMINYDVLFPTPTDSALAAARADTLVPVFIPDIEAAGSARVDTLVYAGVEITNITTDVAYKDGVITYANGKGNVYTGSVASAGSVDFNDFRQPLVNCTFEGNNIEANDFMARFANVGGHLYGKLNLKGNLSGRGSEVPDFVRSLTADGAVAMTEGKLVNFEIVNAMAKQFGFKTFEEETLKNLATLVKIRDGKLVLEGTSLISNMGDWNIDGAVAFLDKKLDLNVGLYLSPEFAKSFNMLGGLLQDDKGRVKVNFKLGGSYDNPTISNISTDKNTVQKKAEDKVKKEAGKLIQDLLKKK